MACVALLERRKILSVFKPSVDICFFMAVNTFNYFAYSAQFSAALFVVVVLVVLLTDRPHSLAVTRASGYSSSYNGL